MELEVEKESVVPGLLPPHEVREISNAGMRRANKGFFINIFHGIISFRDLIFANLTEKKERKC